MDHSTSSNSTQGKNSLTTSGYTSGNSVSTSQSAGSNVPNESQKEIAICSQIQSPAQENAALPKSLFDLVDQQPTMGQQEDFVLPENKRMLNKLGIGLCFVDNADDPQFGVADEEIVKMALSNALTHYAAAEANNINWEVQQSNTMISITPFEGAYIKGITEPFNKKIDAAVNLSDEEGFLLFSGKWVARCSSLLQGVDEGYPKLITEQFPDLTADWTSGVDAAMWSQKANRLLLFRTFEVASYLDPDGPVETGFPMDIASWKPLPKGWQEDFDAALYRPSNGTHYLIKGTETLAILDLDEGPIEGYPKPSATYWEYDETISKWEEGIEAAMYRKDTLYLFRSDPGGGVFAFRDYVNNLPWQIEYNGLSQLALEDLWRNPAMEQLNYTPNWAGHDNFVSDVFTSTNADNGFIIYVTNFPTSHYGYAHDDRRRVVIRYSDYQGIMWQLEYMLFHEMAHIFGAIDEYKDRPDLCPKLGGRFFTGRNRNALSCTDEAEWILGPEPIEIQNVFGFDSVFGSMLDAAYGDYITEVKHFYYFAGNRFRVVANFSDITTGDPLIKDQWLGMPDHFHQDLDAALKIPGGPVYFFKGKEYCAFPNNDFNMLQHGKINDLIPSLPPSFQEGFDAAFHRDTGKVYIFKNNKYLRFSNGIWYGHDPGYPKVTNEMWTGFPNAPIDFTKDFAAVLQDHNRDMYFYKQGQVGVVKHGLKCTMYTTIYDLCKYTRFHLGWGPFMHKIDAACYFPNVDQLFVFNEDHYIRYSNVYEGYDENYPRPVSAGWEGVPSDFKESPNAVLYLDQINMVLFIKEGKCIAFANGEATQIHPLDEIFPNMPIEFYSGVDAAVWIENDNRIYFFKNDLFVAFKPIIASEPVMGPEPIAGGHWPGLPENFVQGLDAVTVDHLKKIYFFKGKKYVRFSAREDGVDIGPAFINDFWMPFPKDAGD